MSITIAIPARYESSRFPGKPLAKIKGKTMLERVVTLAKNAAQKYENVSVFVTTEDKRIANHAEEIGVACIMTPENCKTGSDRVLAALNQITDWPEFVLNLQGDAPFTPPNALDAMIKAFQNNSNLEIVTPVHQLNWEDLNRLRENKKITPFSGTTAIINKDGEALWFSKHIIPAIRNEDELRQNSQLSPVYQHMGLYGFRSDILERFSKLPQGHYEHLEGLEQLRMLENGIKIQAVKIEIDKGLIQSGIDTPEDLIRAEAAMLSGNSEQ